MQRLRGSIYNIPHSYENHWVAQQYLPDVIKNRQYYSPAIIKRSRALKLLG
jgi:putative ATPase